MIFGLSLIWYDLIVWLYFVICIDLGNDGGGFGGIVEVNEDDEEKGENGNFLESDDKDFLDDYDEDSISDSDEEDVVNF